MKRVLLSGPRVTLVPLSMSHASGLRAAITDGELWSLTVTKIPLVDEVGEFIRAALTGFNQGTELAFTVIDKVSGQVVGSTRFMNISLKDKRLEIGYTFFAKSWQRTYVNSETKLLMLTHAFDTLQLNRTELLTDSTNHASMSAIARIGAVKEGVLRHHMVMRDGRLRDSVVYSIIAPQWPEVKLNLQAKMASY